MTLKDSHMLLIAGAAFLVFMGLVFIMSQQAPAGPLASVYESPT